MAKIAIVDDAPEVVVLLSNFITHGSHEFLKRVGTSSYVLEDVVAFRPDLILIPLYRLPEAIGRPLTAYTEQVRGTDVLACISQSPELAGVPVVIFGFSTKLEEMPADFRHKVRFDVFLTFPEGLQELNPIISSLVGPALGDLTDVERVRRGGGTA